MSTSRGIKPHLWFTLYRLMKLGASVMPVKTSTTELAEELGFSQQSASRHLQVLEDKWLIERSMDARGTLIEITREGREELGRVLHDLQYYLEEGYREPVIIEGEVISGLFEGAYYIGKEGYRTQIIEKLGFDPFPGTLNVSISEGEIEKRRRVERGPYIRLEGFEDEERAFGACRCYPLMLNGEVEGALIVADRTSHDMSVMEIISPVYLRRRFDLADGDSIRVYFYNAEDE
ncbi:MAG: DUF120 domain-containing protein [Candidatus Bathyarchaeia archaeon]